MSSGRGTVNKVILVGRLGADPQIRFTPSGKRCATFNLATNQVWKNSSGSEEKRTDWHRVIVWGKLAEVFGEYVNKGDLVYLEGRLFTRKYTDREGAERYITEVVVSQLEMLGGRKHEESGDSGPESSSDVEAAEFFAPPTEPPEPLRTDGLK
jgi:single-strand DNA-binding protein